MGRKKIKIQPIKGERNRSATFLKRKAGLFKKAHELAVLTDSDVAVLVFNRNGKLAEFCSGNIEEFLLRYTEYSGTVERRGPEHFAGLDDQALEQERALPPPTWSSRQPSEVMAATHARIDSRRMSHESKMQMEPAAALQSECQKCTTSAFPLSQADMNEVILSATSASSPGASTAGTGMSPSSAPGSAPASTYIQDSVSLAPMAPNVASSISSPSDLSFREPPTSSDWEFLSQSRHLHPNSARLAADRVMPMSTSDTRPLSATYTRWSHPPLEMNSPNMFPSLMSADNMDARRVPTSLSQASSPPQSALIPPTQSTRSTQPTQPPKCTPTPRLQLTPVMDETPNQVMRSPTCSDRAFSIPMAALPSMGVSRNPDESAFMHRPSCVSISPTSSIMPAPTPLPSPIEAVSFQQAQQMSPAPNSSCFPSYDVKVPLMSNEASLSSTGAPAHPDMDPSRLMMELHERHNSIPPPDLLSPSPIVGAQPMSRFTT